MSVMSHNPVQGGDATGVLSDFRCPVCKAKQALSPVCRRCQAELDLVYKARLRLSYLLSQPQSEEVLKEVRELAPAWGDFRVEG